MAHYNRQTYQRARQSQQSEDVEMGNTNSAMLENIVQTSNCT